MLIERASYFDHPAVSQSMLKTFTDESPFHYYHKHVLKSVPGVDKNTYRFGRAMHALLLEPETFDERYPTFIGEARSNDAKAEKAAMEERAAALDGCVIRTVGEPKIDKIRGCVEAIRANTWAAKLLGAMVAAEMPVTWECEDTGIECKARFDFVSDYKGALIPVDLKKVGSVPKEETLRRQIGTYGYNKQSAHYSAAAKAHFGREVADFYMIFVEDEPPHAVAVHIMDGESMALGHRWRVNALTDLAERRELGRWDFQDKPTLIGVDEWTKRREQ